MAARSAGTPVIGAYWLCPAARASLKKRCRRGSQSKSGKPWPRLTAPCFTASADITVKIVGPPLGRREAPKRAADAEEDRSLAIETRGVRCGDRKRNFTYSSGSARPCSYAPWVYRHATVRTGRHADCPMIAAPR